MCVCASAMTIRSMICFYANDSTLPNMNRKSKSRLEYFFRSPFEIKSNGPQDPCLNQSSHVCHVFWRWSICEKFWCRNQTAEKMSIHGLRACVCVPKYNGIALAFFVCCHAFMRPNVWVNPIISMLSFEFDSCVPLIPSDWIANKRSSLSLHCEWRARFRLTLLSFDCNFIQKIRFSILAFVSLQVDFVCDLYICSVYWCRW